MSDITSMPCSRCGRIVPVVGHDAVDARCWRCTMSTAMQMEAGDIPEPVGPTCAECGEPRAHGARYCPKCATHRARARARERVRQHRSPKNVVL